MIIEGVAELLEHGVREALAVTLATLSNQKYPQYGMTPDSYRGLGPFAIRPRLAFGWTSVPRDVTRFRFER